MTNQCLDTAGLILNFVGAFILAISANIQGDITTDIVDSIVDKYGTWSAGKIDDLKIKKLRSKKQLSKILNWVGYILFAGGFGLQILGK